MQKGEKRSNKNKGGNLWEGVKHVYIFPAMGGALYGWLRSAMSDYIRESMFCTHTCIIFALPACMQIQCIIYCYPLHAHAQLLTDRFYEYTANVYIGISY